MSLNPQYTATPKIGLVTVSAANTARDGSGAIATLINAGASGSRVDLIVATATAATTAGMLRLFLTNNGTSKILAELPVFAATPTASVPAFRVAASAVNADFLPIVLPVGWSIGVSTHNAEAFNVAAFGGDF